MTTGMMDETQKAIRVLGPCGCSQAKLCHPTTVGSHSAVTSPMEVPPVWLYEDYRNSPQRGLSRGVERLAASRLLGMKCLNSQCSWENPRAQTISPARSRPEGWAGHVVGTVTAVPTSISPHPSLQHSIKHWH